LINELFVQTVCQIWASYTIIAVFYAIVAGLYRFEPEQIQDEEGCMVEVPPSMLWVIVDLINFGWFIITPVTGIILVWSIPQ